MKKMLRYIVVFLLCIALLSGVSTNKISNKVYSIKEYHVLSTEEKTEDFEYMFNIIKNNYPFLEVNKRIYGIDWVKNKDKYKKRIISSNSDEEFFNSMDDILKDLHNGHTSMVSPEEYIYLKRNYEGLYKKNKDYKSWIDVLNNQSSINRYLNNTRKIDDNKIKKDTCINIKTDIIEDNSIGYIKINSFSSHSIQEDSEIIETFLESAKECNGLIIDIRGNTRGDIEYWQKELVSKIMTKPIKYHNYIAYRGGEYQKSFIHNYNRLKNIEKIFNYNLENLPPEIYSNFNKFKKERKKIKPKNSIRYKGKIFLLIDGSVSSSAEMLASFCKRTGFATLIGEITGGDGIGGDPIVCALPNSGYIFTFSQGLGMSEDGSCNYEYRTKPDYTVNAKVYDTYEKDAVIQKAISLLGMLKNK